MKVVASGRRHALRLLPFGFLAATIGIYMILCLLFASMRQPIAVLASIPFGIIGVVLGHLLTGYNLTFLVWLGSSPFPASS